MKIIAPVQNTELHINKGANIFPNNAVHSFDVC